MRMNKLFAVLGGTGAVLLLGSFFADGAPQDVMRLTGFVLLGAYCIGKGSKGGKRN